MTTVHASAHSAGYVTASRDILRTIVNQFARVVVETPGDIDKLTDQEVVDLRGKIDALLARLGYF